MEFDPVILGSQYQVIPYQVVIGTTPKQVVPSNPSRVAILFSPGNTAGIGVWPGAGVAFASMMQLSQTNDYTEFVFSRHGPLPGYAWYAAANVGAPSLSVIEIVYRPGGS